MLRHMVLGRQIDEFLLDAFIVCVTAANLFHPLETVAAVTFILAVLLCIDFSTYAPQARSHGARDSYRTVPVDLGRPG